MENNGVVPDTEVTLDRQELLQSTDAQLKAAIEYAAEYSNHAQNVIEK